MISGVLNNTYGRPQFHPYTDVGLHMKGLRNPYYCKVSGHRYHLHISLGKSAHNSLPSAEDEAQCLDNVSCANTLG